MKKNLIDDIKNMKEASIHTRKQLNVKFFRNFITFYSSSSYISQSLRIHSLFFRKHRITPRAQKKTISLWHYASLSCSVLHLSQLYTTIYGLTNISSQEPKKKKDKIKLIGLIAELRIINYIVWLPEERKSSKTGRIRWRHLGWLSWSCRENREAAKTEPGILLLKH